VTNYPPTRRNEMYDAKTMAALSPTMDQRLLKCAAGIAQTQPKGNPNELSRVAEIAGLIPNGAHSEDDYDDTGYLAPLIRAFQKEGSVECPNCGTPHPAAQESGFGSLLQGRGMLERCSCHFR
jgi:hypothetical protein